MSLPRALLILATITLSSVLTFPFLPVAEAWDSKCTAGAPGSEEDCGGGFGNARGRWNTPHSEHDKIWSTMIPLAGLPTEYASDEFNLKYYVEEEDVDPGPIPWLWPSIPSVYPSWVNVHSSATRTISPAEMTQLADFSYSLYDWASGNETCPPAPDEPFGWDPYWCHHYFTHMGPINASHFLPMAEHFWAHYHALALERAEACRGLEDNLDEDTQERFEKYRGSCEQLAMTLEAASQHYLQDAFSMGHTWERWGGNEIDDLDSLTQGIVIAGMAGMVHGFKNTDVPGLDTADDPMCAPAPTGTEIQFIDGVDLKTPVDAVGDIFWPLVNPVTGTQDPLYSAQSAALLGCTASSAREVYEAGGQVQGPLEPPNPNIEVERDHWSDECWGQRATNSAIATGLGIHFGAHPNQSNLSSDSIWQGTSAMLLYAGLKIEAIPVVGTVLDGAELIALSAELSLDTLNISSQIFNAAKNDPLGTTAATSQLPSLLGIAPNGQFASALPGTVGDLDNPPASWVDPPMPWAIGDTGPIGEKRSILSLAFTDATAIDRCDTMTLTDFTYAADYVHWARLNEPESQPAACGVCIDLVEPHIRVGDESSWEVELEPLCSFVDDVSPQYVYVPGTTAEIGSTELAAAHFCGCPWEGPLVLSSLPAEDPTDPDSIATFDPSTGMASNLCENGGSPPDLGESYRTDILPIPGGLPSWAVSYPYLRELRLYPADCSPITVADTVTLPLAGPGPVSLELTPDGTEIIVAAADPNDPCAPGAVHLYNSLSLDLRASFSTPMGVGDVTVAEGDDGTKILFTLPGDGQFSGQCLSWHLGEVDLQDLRDAGDGLSALTWYELPIVGSGTNDPTRIVSSESGEFVVYTMAHSYGRIGVRHVPSGTTVLLDSETILDGVSSEPYIGSWDTPEDIAVLEGPGPGQLLIMYVNQSQTENQTLWSPDQCLQACDEEDTNPWNNPSGQGLCNETPYPCSESLCAGSFIDCDFCSSPIPCSATGYVLLDVSNPDVAITEIDRGIERGLPYAYANRIWLHEESGQAYVSYLNRSRLTTVHYTPSAEPGWEPDTWKRTEVGAWPIEIWGP